MSGLKINTHRYTPIQAGEITVQPISQSVHWAGKWFGFVWNRPVAVRVEDGQASYQLPVRDLTRVALIILWGLTAVFSFAILSPKSKKRSKS